MNPFYKLNQTLANIGKEHKQINESVAKAVAEVKTPARVSLEQSLKQDMKSLMEGSKPDFLDMDKDGDKKEPMKKAVADKKKNPFAKKDEKVDEDASGGMAQSNTLEDMDESALQAYLGKEKYGKAGMQALQKAGRDGAGKEKMNNIRNQYDKIDEAPRQIAKLNKEIQAWKNAKDNVKYSANTVDPLDRASINSKTKGTAKTNQSLKQTMKSTLGKHKQPHLPEEADMEEGNEFSGQLVQARAQGRKDFKVDGKQYQVTDESGLPDVADKKAKMAQARGDRPSPLKNVGKGLKAFFKGEPEPMDEEAEMIEFLTRKAGPQGHAESHPYNKSPGMDAHNGMTFEQEQTTMEAVSRKHFQQVADLLKNIPDEAKRKEMAMHHAAIFSQQNPRFDMRRFGQACGVDLEECAMYEELKGGQHKLDVDHDGDIGADDLADLRAGHEVDEGYGEMDAWLKSREKEKGTGKFDSRKVSTGTVYTRKFDDAPEDDTDAPASKGGAPRGRGRPAKVKGPERVTAKAYKHKGGRMNETGACPHCGGNLNEEPELDEAAVEAGKRHFFDKLAPAAKKAAQVVKAVTGGKKKAVDEESTDKEDTKAEKAGKKVAKDIEHDEDHKGKDDDRAEKAGKKVTKDIEYDDKKDRKEKKSDKEEKVDETTTSGSVATASTGKKSSAGSVGKGIYDSWEREFKNLLAESVSVKEETTMAEQAEEGDAETMTITATGDDVARLREVLAQLGVTQGSSGHDHGHDEPYANSEKCGTCGGTPCQCDDQMDSGMGLPGAVEFEIDEQYGDDAVDQNSPDYPSNQECSDNALQYSGGLNGPKSTGQSTTPVLASQLRRQTSMESKDSVDSFLSLYQAFKTK